LFEFWTLGKRVVDFLLVLIKLIWLGVTAEALRAKIHCVPKKSDAKIEITINYGISYQN